MTGLVRVIAVESTPLPDTAGKAGLTLQVKAKPEGAVVTAKCPKGRPNQASESDTGHQEQPCTSDAYSLRGA